MVFEWILGQESFHKAAEQALHTSGPHRVLYLHAEEVRQQLGADRSFLEEVEAEIVARMREEDGKRNMFQGFFALISLRLGSPLTSQRGGEEHGASRHSPRSI